MQITPLVRRVAHYLKYETRNPLAWSKSDFRNWGDDLNPWLFNKLTGKKATYCPHKTCKRLLMVGSILTGAGAHDVCWGTGLITDKLTEPLKLSKALSVRGPLSRKKLYESGIVAPEIYGDPGLIASKLIPLPSQKKYKKSLVPHYVDREKGEIFAKENDFHIIHVDLPIEKFIEEVASSDEVWSSSLHGIICAESLQIATVWVKFSDKIKGGTFKFNDYFLGTGRDIYHPLDLSCNSKSYDIPQILPHFDVDTVIKDLLSVFPGETVVDL